MTGEGDSRLKCTCKTVQEVQNIKPGQPILLLNLCGISRFEVETKFFESKLAHEQLVFQGNLLSTSSEEKTLSSSWKVKDRFVSLVLLVSVYVFAICNYVLTKVFKREVKVEDTLSSAVQTVKSKFNKVKTS